ncbi:MAG: SRPBCC family protein [Acidobacteriota bacterium]|nr:SRPBCC family protein [Acidobacteriota bacterium]
MDTWEVTFDENRDAEMESAQTKGNGTNVGKIERIASAVGGGALIGYAIKTRSKTGVLLGLLGASLLYRGASGQCELYRVAGINTAGNADDDTAVARDVHVEKTIAINSTPRDLYNFWRDLENLPRFMENLESVTQLDGNRSHWVAIGPGGKKIEWDAEIYNEKEGELIAWRSLPGADITNAGSVHFEEAPGGRTAYVRVTLNYNPPGGKAAALFAKLFGQEPGQLVEHNLKRLKQLIETGEIPTTEGQPSGRMPESSSGQRDASGERKAHKVATKTPATNLSRAAPNY